MIVCEHDDNVNFKLYNDTHDITQYNDCRYYPSQLHTVTVNTV